MYFWQDASSTYVTQDKNTWMRAGPGHKGQKASKKGAKGGLSTKQKPPPPVSGAIPPLAFTRLS